MKIGIAISGGGYRATSYGLGTLSYLDHLEVNGQPLTKHLVSMSTVSGGSIAGITFAQWTKAGLSFKDYFKWLYLQITEYDLVTDSIENYVGDSKKNSLIEGFSSSYSKKLLLHTKLWSILPDDNTTLKYYSINATDFNTGNPFRFIAQPKNKRQSNKSKVNAENKESTPAANNNKRLIVGNSFFRITENVHQLPLDLALAASSCFPGGFEPIILKLDKFVKDNNKKPFKKVSLMDGGIVDNQGIEALLLCDDKDPLDLAIIVDSASPNINEYEQSKLPHIPVIGNISLKKIEILLRVFLIINVILLAYTFLFNTLVSLAFTVFFAGLLTVILILCYTMKEAKKSFHKALKDNHLNTSNFQPLGLLTPNSIVQLLKNRVSSGSLLVGTVFLKHIRRLNTTNLYKDENLKNRILYNSLYQFKLLNRKEEFLRMNNSQTDEYSIAVKESLLEVSKTFYLKHRNEIDQIHDQSKKINKIKYLINSGLYNSQLKKHNENIKKQFGKLVDISERAFKMDTTLWVSREASGKSLVKDVIVMGQISTCCNIIGNPYLKKNHAEIVQKAKSDWEKFKINPYWLFDELYKNDNDVMSIFKNKQSELKKEYDLLLAVENL